jgi:hypothetical protein
MGGDRRALHLPRGASVERKKHCALRAYSPHRGGIDGLWVERGTAVSWALEITSDGLKELGRICARFSVKGFRFRV